MITIIILHSNTVRQSKINNPKQTEIRVEINKKSVISFDNSVHSEVNMKHIGNRNPLNNHERHVSQKKTIILTQQKISPIIPDSYFTFNACNFNIVQK